jgi:porin
MVEQGRGVRFTLDASIEIFGNPSGGTTRTAICESLFIAGINADLEKAIGAPGLSLVVNGLYAAGPSLTNKSTHEFNRLSNIDAYDSIRLYEAWLEQAFWDGRLSIRLGQILADAEFFVSDYGGLLINSSFGAIPLVSENLEAPVFPVAAPGFRVRATPGDSFYAQAAVFSGDIGDSATNNKHGTRFSFRDGALCFFEFGYHINPTPAAAPSPPASARLAGTYKLGGFYDSGEFEANSGRQTKQGDYGIYLLAQQEVWHPDNKPTRALAVFGRMGAAPDDRNTVPFYFDAGFNFRGILPTRTDDIAGLGFSYTKVSSGTPAHRGHEKVVELTYQMALHEHIFLQPDLQFIINPGALESAETVVAAGLRLQISY